MDTSKYPKQGFALVVALSLMSFILLLLLSLTSLVRVSSEASSMQMDVIRARQNALFSAQIALGKLQYYVGKDQRVTALSGNSETGFTGAGSVQAGSKYWLGVWDADEDSDTYGEQLGAQSEEDPEWLISGGKNLDPTIDDLLLASGVDASGKITAEQKEEYALLVGPGDVSTQNKDDMIVAPIIPIDDNAGGYAWWVSDEGQKVKILGDRHEMDYENLSPDEINSLMTIAPQRNGLEAITGLQSFERGSLGHSDISKLGTLGDSAMLVAGNVLHDAVRTNYHSLSLHSQAVLADVKNGGLKKDLTHEFHPTVSKNVLTNQQVFGQVGLQDKNRRSRIKSDHDLGGPYWDQFKSFANTKPNEGLIDFQPQSDKQFGVMPIVTQIKWYYYAYWAQAGANASLRFVILPRLVLNNPYSSDLVMPDTYFQVLHGPTGNVYDAENRPNSDDRDPGFKIKLYGGSTLNGAFELPVDIVNIGSKTVHGHWPEGIVYRIVGTTIPAGATRVFSPGASSASPALNELVRNGSGSNDLSVGDRPGSGFYIDVPNSATAQLVTGYMPRLQLIGDHSNDIHLLFGTGFEQSSEGRTITDPFKMIYRLGAWGLGGSGSSVFAAEERPASNKAPLPDDVTMPIFGFDHSMRLHSNYFDSANLPEKGSGHKIPWLAHYNPAANLSGRTPHDWNPQRFYGCFNTNPTYMGGTVKHSDDYKVNGSDSPYFGYADDSGGNSVVLFELPTETIPLTSIGQLMHANPSRNNDFDFTDKSLLDEIREEEKYDEYYFFGNIHPTYAIGNSLANAKIPDYDGNRDGKSDLYVSWEQQYRRKDSNGVGRKGVHYDYSYLLNDRLWDSYFFSAIDFDKADVVGNFPHTNSRLLPYKSPDNADFTGDGFERSAANLMLDGAFNVNSTSKEAWKAILSSYMKTGAEPVSQEANMQRMIDPLGSAFMEGDSDSNINSYLGYRRLNLEQIDKLAEEIVKEIRVRTEALKTEKGRPFLSLSEFINRSIDSTLRGTQADLRLKGAIQAALDESDVNASLNTKLVEPSSMRDFPDEDHAQDYVSKNIMTYVSQADILARLGSVLTVRSDTFLIRTYGDARDPISGEIKSKAWCELVVQRVPEYVSQNDEAYISPDNLEDEENREWGRRCKLVSMRWLTEEDILN